MMDRNQQALLEAIKHSLFGTPTAFPSDVDWEQVLREAMAQTVVSLAAPAVPADEAVKWQTPEAQNTAQYMRVLFEQTKLVKLLHENNIPFVIIKGAAAAMYYPKPSLRAMGDVDFLAAPGYFDQAAELLLRNGYTPDPEHESERHSVFSKGGVELELHRRYSDQLVDMESVIANGVKHAVMREVNGQCFPSLPDDENGLVLLDHIRHHLRGIGLRQIVDWAVFAGRFLSNEHYNRYFLPLLEPYDLVLFCKTVTKMCKMYLGLPGDITWCDDVDENAAAELFDTVLNNGNFGRKVPKTAGPVTGVAVARLSFHIKRNGLFKALQTRGIRHFAICRRNRFFRCFAWLFQVFRFIWLGTIELLKGRDRHFIRDMQDENKKNDLYKRIGVNNW